MMAETISMLPVTSGSQQVSCDPCSRDSKTIECQGYCTECQENLCEACINHHRKLKLTLGHKIVKSGKLVPLMQKDATVIPKCAIHSGFEVCSFCEKHDKLCCNICETVDHKNCESVFKILDYVTKAKLDEVTSNLKTQLEDTRDAYDAVVKSKDKHTENLTKQKDDALKSISDSCTKIFNLIDKLRDRTVKKVMTCFAKATELLDNTVTDCQARSLSMDKHLKHLGTKTECINDIVRFIEIKLIKESFQKNGGPLDGNRKTQLPELEFTASNEIVDMLHNTDSLAEVGVFGEHKLLGTVKLTKNGAKRSTSVSDMAILNDGRVITCDYHHSQLVVLDSKLNYLKHYHLPFPPTGICTDKSNNVIMSHRSKLSIVSLDPSLEIKGSIDTKSAINYNGIASHGEEIYVLHDKGPAVAVYDCKGKQVCHSKTPIHSPAGIAVSPDGTWIAVSSFNENSVITFDKSLKMLRKIENLSRLVGPFSLVIDAKKRMYVSVKNNVFIIMPDSQTTLLDDNNSFDGWPIVKHCKNSGSIDTKSAINYNGIASHGEAIYVLHDKDPVVAVYDRKGKQVCHSKTSIQAPAGIAVSPDGTWIAVSSFNENSVITFDKALKVLRKIENLSRLVGPFSLVIDAKKRMYVSVKNNVFIIMPDSQTTLLDDNNSFDGWPIVKHCKNSGKLLVITNPWKSIAIWQP